MNVILRKLLLHLDTLSEDMKWNQCEADLANGCNYMQMVGQLSYWLITHSVQQGGHWTGSDQNLYLRKFVQKKSFNITEGGMYCFKGNRTNEAGLGFSAAFFLFFIWKYWCVILWVPWKKTSKRDNFWPYLYMLMQHIAILRLYLASKEINNHVLKIPCRLCDCSCEVYLCLSLQEIAEIIVEIDLIVQKFWNLLNANSLMT